MKGLPDNLATSFFAKFSFEKAKNFRRTLVVSAVWEMDGSHGLQALFGLCLLNCHVYRSKNLYILAL